MSIGAISEMHFNSIHGHNTSKGKSPTYITWDKMKTRCNNPNHERYKDYGGKGIKVCVRWNSFVNFLKDMGERPEGKTLDRIDTTKGYSKSNCRWATIKQQMRNRNNTLMFTYEGKTKPLKEWAEEIGSPYMTLYNRIARGWSNPKEILYGRQ